ncbi:MAG: hypothetical protein ACI8Z1_000936 [Candidatus Azotimanducaceae bacterium]|jgi:hypothetical protein
MIKSGGKREPSAEQRAFSGTKSVQLNKEPSAEQRAFSGIESLQWT